MPDCAPRRRLWSRSLTPTTPGFRTGWRRGSRTWSAIPALPWWPRTRSRATRRCDPRASSTRSGARRAARRSSRCCATTSCSTQAPCSSGGRPSSAAGGFSELPMAEDWDTWLAIAQALPDRVHRRGRRPGQAPLEQHHPAQRARAASRSQLGDRRPPSRRPPARLEAAARSAAAPRLPPTFTPAWAARSWATGGSPGATRWKRSPSTRSRSRRRKLALLARVFVSESLVARLSRALRDDARLARELTGHAVVKPDA